MAYTETNIRRDASSSTIKMVTTDATTDTTIFDLKGVKTLYLVCNGNTNAYLPTVSDAGVMTVPASDLAYAEVTGIDTVGGGGDVERQGVPNVGTTGQPMFFPEGTVPSHVYFVLPTTATAWLYLTY